MNILIIGSSNAIKKLFQDKFKGNNINYISFRESWVSEKNNKYDIIVVSGFHFSITSLALSSLNEYVSKYIDYLNNLSERCEKLYLVSTDLKIEFSISRVVYFYYILLKKILLKNKKIKILSFYSMLNAKNDKMKIFIFKFLKKNFTLNFFADLRLDELCIKEVEKINFNFIGLPRSRGIDRILRIFDK